MTQSRVDIGALADHSEYRGRVTSLNGTGIAASVGNQAGVRPAIVSEPPLPRLLNGVGDRPMAELAGHLHVHGPPPDLRRSAPPQLIDLIELAGLRGRGGAGFPAATKLRAVSSKRGPRVVVANGTEGEPLSKKDRVLLREVPHLVLDGAAVAAHAVGADSAIIAVSERQTRSLESLARALDEREQARLPGPRFELVPTPDRFLSGQESALVNILNGREAKPSFGAKPFERGVGQRPTLVQNVETLAHMALIARRGAAWFRQLGTERNPGSTLLTVAGAVAKPGVYEIDHGMPLTELLELAGIRPGLAAVLVGGYFGTWLTPAQITATRLAAEHLAVHGASLGAGVIFALNATACPVAETARIADFFATQAAGQCGTCVNSLDAIADTIARLAAGNAGVTAQSDLARWTDDLPGRGACRHPDGAARFVASSLRTFAREFRDHARGGNCENCSGGAQRRSRPHLSSTLG